MDICRKSKYTKENRVNYNNDTGKIKIIIFVYLILGA